ncbi:hypothetical protein NMG60_11037517, partial [Bertholletia excelsa]
VVAYPPRGPATEVGSGPYVMPQPPIGYPSKDGNINAQHPTPSNTTSRGDGFLKGCLAGLCCGCCLDMCF